MDYTMALLINVRENKRDNRYWAIQRHKKHWTRKTLDEDKENTKTTNGKLCLFREQPTGRYVYLGNNQREDMSI